MVTAIRRASAMREIVTARDGHEFADSRHERFRQRTTVDVAAAEVGDIVNTITGDFIYDDDESGHHAAMANYLM